MNMPNKIFRKYAEEENSQSITAISPEIYNQMLNGLQIQHDLKLLRNKYKYKTHIDDHECEFCEFCEDCHWCTQTYFL